MWNPNKTNSSSKCSSTAFAGWVIYIKNIFKINLGSTLECLIGYLVNVPKEPEKAKIVDGITNECRKEVMRVAELQSDDFHLDRINLIFLHKKND
jgi:hypothetical protein